MKREKSLKERGQALVEFALILPVLMLIVAGIFDFGRVIFTYAQASQQLRTAVREAPVIGFGDANIPYLQCQTIREIAQDVYFTEGDPAVTVTYIDHENYPATIAPAPCLNNGDIDEGDLKTGDILRVESVGTIRPVFFNFFNGTDFTFTFVGQRTIVKSISLGSGDARDKDYDGLIDEWEILCVGNLDQNGLDYIGTNTKTNGQVEQQAENRTGGPPAPYNASIDCVD